MLARLTVVLALATLGSGLVLAGLHLGDLYAVQHVSGIWMVLARSLNEGVFYPPLESTAVMPARATVPCSSS